MKVAHVQAAGSIQQANEKFFRFGIQSFRIEFLSSFFQSNKNQKHFHSSMDKYQNEARLSLMMSLEGPQDIELEMSMTVFRDGQPSGTNVARIFIFVSEFQY